MERKPNVASLLLSSFEVYMTNKYVSQLTVKITCYAPPNKGGTTSKFPNLCLFYLLSLHIHHIESILCLDYLESTSI